MGKNVEALTQAATQAQALGLSMKQVEQISESMLNFEDSIGKELEAQLLTGGNINLAKAREHALTGDMVGLTNEIQKQEVIAFIATFPEDDHSKWQKCLDKFKLSCHIETIKNVWKDKLKTDTTKN
jgi:hypothetical protein